MKRKNFVKLTAIATAAAMAISPAMVFAADSEVTDPANATSTINGAGGLEGIVNKEVFKVVLPTVQDTNFTLDPQGLLKIANKDAYAIGAGAIYFTNKASDGGQDTYSGTSDAIEILNKSSYAIDVAFSVKVELPEGITMVESEDALANATTPSVYLAMKEENDTAATALKAGDNVAVVKTVAGVAEDANNDAAGKGYYIKADTSGATRTYTYELGSGFANTDAKKASYKLSGKCDSTADWSKVNALEADKKNVKTTIVWTAKKHEDYTDATAHGNWSSGTLWLAKDANTGFSTTGLIVEVSDGGTTYKTLASDKYGVNDGGWVSTTWGNIIEELGVDVPSGTVYIRVTDGSVRYVFENK